MWQSRLEMSLPYNRKENLMMINGTYNERLNNSYWLNRINSLINHLRPYFTEHYGKTENKSTNMCAYCFILIRTQPVTHSNSIHRAPRITKIENQCSNTNATRLTGELYFPIILYYHQEKGRVDSFYYYIHHTVNLPCFITFCLITI